MNFKELGLKQPMLDEVIASGYENPTAIQQLAIPIILSNKDMVGVAQTGTGKTAAFALPIIDKLIEKSKPDKKIKVLVLSPTRELALQIRDNMRDFMAHTEFKCSVVLGGVNQTSQINVLKKGVDVLVATPGRLLDLSKRKFVNLSNVEMLVLDEADTMLDMGFIKDVTEIINKTPKTRQTMLFSATMPSEVKALASKFLINPMTVSATPISSSAPKIKQLFYYVDKGNKVNLLLDILKDDNIKSTLIFTRTKHGANKLGESLEKSGLSCSVIHGNKSQTNRVKALNDFKKGHTSIMIATDIAARGIDINELSLVVNYDMPEQPESYVHRIGRTARAGLEGISISLVTADEIDKLKAVEKLIKKNIDEVENIKYPMRNAATPVTRKPSMSKPYRSNKGKKSSNSYGSSNGFNRNKRYDSKSNSKKINNRRVNGR